MDGIFHADSSGKLPFDKFRQCFIFYAVHQSIHRNVNLKSHRYERAQSGILSICFPLLYFAGQEDEGIK